jgi:hypothetical protein
MEKKQSNYQRILRIMKFYLLRGVCKERVNRVYRKIINERLKIKL